LYSRVLLAELSRADDAREGCRQHARYSIVRYAPSPRPIDCNALC
jgi:hypothetical protein